MSFRRLGDPFSSRYSRLGSGSRPGGGIAPVVFLFRDDFLTDEAAPLVTPRTAEPGPGIGTIVDGTNIFSINSSNFVANGVPAANSAISYESLPRSAGLAMYFNNTGLTTNTGENTTLGFADAIAPVTTNNVKSGLFVPVDGISAMALSINGVYKGLSLPILTNKDGFIVLRNAGFFFVLDRNLEWVDNIESNATIFPVMSVNGNGAQTRDYSFGTFRGSQLPTPWDSDNGIATQVLAGVRAAGDTFTHEADCLIEFEVTTVPAALQIELRFRIQDASNFWQVTIDSTGALDLDEVVATVVTQRGTAAGVIVNGDRIVIIADDETIRVYEANVLRITYALAVNFKTETAGELETEGTGGAVSDIISWPRVISGDALTALNRVADA